MADDCPFLRPSLSKPTVTEQTWRLTTIIQQSHTMMPHNSRRLSLTTTQHRRMDLIQRPSMEAARVISKRQEASPKQTLLQINGPIQATLHFHNPTNLAQPQVQQKKRQKVPESA